MKKIIFVCTGNTCRSPMAEAIAKREAKKGQMDMMIVSRGVAVRYAAGANEYSVQAMEEMDIDIKGHRASQFKKEEIDENTWVITMTRNHVYYILREYPELEGKVHSIYGLLGQEKDVDDPFGNSIDVYKNCAKEIENLVIEVMRVIGGIEE